MSKIERLTEDEREAVRRGTCQASGPKALRIIDRLTAALEAAERAQSTAAKFNQNLVRQRGELESRADARQARTAELEGKLQAVETHAKLWHETADANLNRALAAESELAQMRERVERALTVYSYFEREDLPAEVALRRIAEVLRGR